MARRGRRPVPSGLRTAGPHRPDRLNTAEPVPDSGCGPPEPPASLCPAAKAKWRSLAPDLYRAGVLTHWDVEAFAAYCDLAVQVERSRESLNLGLLTKGRRDPFVTNPMWRIHRDALSLLRTYAMEFGLTPASRVQIRAVPPRDLDPRQPRKKQAKPTLP